MARVVKRAGGSTSTVYNEFGGKQGLFLEVLAHQAREMQSIMDALDLDSMSLEDGMMAFGSTYLRAMFGSGFGAFYPIVTSESSRFPELQQLLRCLANHTRDKISAFVSAKVREQSLHIKEPARAARTFVTLLRGHLLEVKMDMIKSVRTENFLREAVQMTISAYTANGR